MQKFTNERLGRSIQDILKENKITSLDFFDDKNEPQYLIIAISKININDLLLSRHLDEEELDKIATSIQEYGVITPIVVRKNENQTYDLITGIKRLRAVEKLDIKVIPAIVLNIDLAKTVDIMINYNNDNDILNPIEKANTYSYMSKVLNLNQNEIAKKVNRSRPYITNHLRLLNLPKKIQNYLIEGKLSFGQARPLINLKPEESLSLAELIIKEQMSAREVECLAGLSLSNVDKKSIYQGLCKNISSLYDCGVKIKSNEVILKAKNKEDLERILNLIIDKKGA